MRARQAVPIYFVSTLIKRKLIATSLIMLQAAFDDVRVCVWGGVKLIPRNTLGVCVCVCRGGGLGGGVLAQPGYRGDKNLS